MTRKPKPTYGKRFALGITVVSGVVLLSTAILLVGFYEHVMAEDEFLLLAAGFALNAIVYNFLALLIIARYPRHIIGWLFLSTGLLSAVLILSGALGEVLASVSSDSLVRLVIVWIGEVSWLPAFIIPLTLVLLFFPDGRLPSRRWRLILLASFIGITGASVSIAFHTWPWEAADLNYPYNPFAIPGSDRFFESLITVSEISLVLGILGSAAALFVRYFRSQGPQRLQIKWFAYSALVIILFMVLTSTLLDPNLIYFLSGMLPLPLAITIGVAILRYRLYDIDIIIRRTLVYGLVTATLVAIYFGSVVLLQNLFSGATGQQSPVAIVISTLIIASLFNPLRRRVQDFIDRRFYRTKYDAQKTLARFAQTARNETDIEALTYELLSVVEETMQPEQVSLWLKTPGPKENK